MYICFSKPEDRKVERDMAQIRALGWKCSRRGWDEKGYPGKVPSSRAARFVLSHPDPAQPDKLIGGSRSLRNHLLERSSAELTSLRANASLRPTGTILNPDRAAVWLKRGRKVTLADISGAVRSAGIGFQVIGLDAEFWILPPEHWDEIIAETKVDQVRYVSERSDCENFAQAFSGLAGLRYGINTAGFALDNGGRHAYNLIPVDVGGAVKIRLFEPQSDKWVTASLGQAPYVGQSGYVFFG